MGGGADVDLSWLVEPEVESRRIAGVALAGGQPVAGAAVELRAELYQLAGEAPPRAVTGADGSFDFGPRPATRYAVVARHTERGFGGQLIDLGDPEARPGELRLFLTGEPLRRGRVRDLDGAPIADATVVYRGGELDLDERPVDVDGRFVIGARRAGYNLVRAPGYGSVPLADHMPAGGWDVVLLPESRIEGVVIEADGRPIPGARVLFMGGLQLATTASDAEGRFVLEGLRPAIGSVTADRPGPVSPGEHLSLGAGETRRDVVIRAEPWRSIAGVVLAGGAPLDGAWIGGARTGGGGRFSIPRASTGALELHVSGHDGPAITAPPGTRPIDKLTVRIGPRGAVEGRVVAGGAGVAGAEVIDSAARTIAATTGAAGQFRIPALPPGQHTFEARDRDSGRRSAPVRVAIAGGEPTAIELALDRAGEITGVVVDAAGAPVSGFALELAGAERRESATDPRGRFRLTGLTAGRYELRAHNRLSGADLGDWARPAGGDAWPAIVLERDDSVVDCRLELRGAVDQSIAGQVIDDRGGPIAGARVTAFDAVLEDQRAATTDHEGRFVLAELPEGGFELRALAPDGSFGSAPARAGDDSVIVRVAPGVGAIEGEVIGAGAGCRVSAASHPLIAGVEVTTSSGGRFRIEGLAAGPTQLRVASGERRGVAQVEVRSGETVEVSIALTDPLPLELRVRRFPGGEPAPAGVTCEIEGATAVTNAAGVARFEAPPRGAVAIMCALEEQQLGGMTSLMLDPDATGAEAYVVELPDFDDVVRGHPDLRFEDGPDRLLVQSMSPGGRGERAGLRPGDRIVEVAGAAADGAASMAALLYLTAAPAPIALAVDRDGERLELLY